MTLWEAMKEGAVVRRFCCLPFMALVVQGGALYWCDTGEPATLPKSDLRKSDWIIDQPRKGKR